MGTWNHRVIQYDEKNFGIMYGIHEVYYDDDGAIFTWTAKAVGIQAESIKDLSIEADRMMQAIALPVLKESELLAIINDKEVSREPQNERLDGAGG